MFTGTPEELKHLEAQAGAIAASIAARLDALEALGLGAVAGQVYTPVGVIRWSSSGWTVVNR